MLELGTNLPRPSPGEVLSFFGVSPVNYSDSDSHVLLNGSEACLHEDENLLQENAKYLSGRFHTIRHVSCTLCLIVHFVVFVLDINDCVQSNCANGATCVDGINNYTCSCTPGWEGHFCDKGKTKSYQYITPMQ